LWTFAVAVSAAEWFFIAALSAAMKKVSFSAFSLWGVGPHGPEAVPRAKRAVMSYSRTYPHSKAATIRIAEGLRA
jgi:hypothetical protein